MFVPYTLDRRPASGLGALFGASRETANGLALLLPSGASAAPTRVTAARATIAPSIQMPGLAARRIRGEGNSRMVNSPRRSAPQHHAGSQTSATISKPHGSTCYQHV